MACELDNELKRVIFLYKLKEGGSLKSHGMNVASLAGVPEDIIAKAEVVSNNFHAKFHDPEAAEKKESQLPLTVLSDFAALMTLPLDKLRRTLVQYLAH